MDLVDQPTAQKAIEAAGYKVHSIEQTPITDVGHTKFVVEVTGQDITEPRRYHASFYTDFVKGWEGKRFEPIFGGEASVHRQAEIYNFARSKGIPMPETKAEEQEGHAPFVLEEVLKGTPLKRYIQALPEEQREAAYLAAVHKVGALFANAHTIELGSYGDYGEKSQNFDFYEDRLQSIITSNLGWNGHETFFGMEELERVRTYARKLLETVVEAEGYMPDAVFVLANPHRGNVYLDEQGNIVGLGECFFAQAAPPAADMYNARLQFADADVTTADKAHAALLNGYWRAGGKFEPNHLNAAIMRVLEFNHFLYAATAYGKMSNPMRKEWGRRFKEDFVLPMTKGAQVDADAFSAIINEKWK